MGSLSLRVFLRWLPVVVLGSLSLLLFFPTPALAHAVLLRSDPARNAVLSTPPQMLRLWFSERLDPVLSSVMVVDEHNRRVDQQDAHVSSTDPQELVRGLPDHLSPAVYIVVWQ